jgi:hypothetical protein
MDIKAIKQKLNALQSTGQKKEKVDYTKYLWKPKAEGKYQIRVVPSVLNKSNPFQEVFVHYGFSKFPIYALTNWGEKDPIVEFAKSLRNTSEKENWQLAKKLDPKMRVFAPIVVRGEEDKGVRLWEFGKEIYMQLLGIAEDEDYGDFTDISEGRDFTVDVVTGDIGGRQGLKSSIRVKPKTTPLNTDAETIKMWLEEQPNILEIQRKMDFDALKEILQNWLTPEDETEEVEEEEVEEEVENTSSEAPAEDPILAKAKESKANYSLKTPAAKVSKADKFDALFDDEDESEGEGSPF